MLGAEPRSRDLRRPGSGASGSGVPLHLGCEISLDPTARGKNTRRMASAGEPRRCRSAGLEKSDLAPMARSFPRRGHGEFVRISAMAYWTMGTGVPRNRLPPVRMVEERCVGVVPLVRRLRGLGKILGTHMFRVTQSISEDLVCQSPPAYVHKAITSLH